MLLPSQLELSGLKNSRVFCVPTSQRGDVYMSISRTNYMNDERMVVEVDAEKFLQLWRNERFSLYPELNMGTPEIWKADRKFADAEEGFSKGRKNPVPLAKAYCQSYIKHTPIVKPWLYFFEKIIGHTSEPTPYATFENGVTRTIWLLSFGAKIFPIECRLSDVELFREFAATGPDSIKSVSELVPNTVL